MTRGEYISPPARERKHGIIGVWALVTCTKKVINICLHEENITANSQDFSQKVYSGKTLCNI